MSGTLRLLRLEARRNPGLWLLPLLVGVAWWLATDKLPGLVALWLDTSLGIRSTIVFLGPVMGGLAAWVAEVDRRRRVEELLASTPRPSALRDLLRPGGTLLWGVLTYATVAAALLSLTSLRATWGGPHWQALQVGLLAIAACSALGYAAGAYARSRFTAPLVAVALFVAQLLPGVQSEIRSLSPFDDAYRSVFFSPEPDAGLPHTLWLLGLTAVGAAALVLRGRRTPLAWGALAMAIAIAGTGAAMVLQADYPARRVPIPYEPVCETAAQGIPVCVHPAYRAMLPETAALVGRIAGPLVGVPGGPQRAEQGQPNEWDFLPDGTLRFELLGHPVAYRTLEENASRALIGDETRAQLAVMLWLQAQAGADVSPLLRGMVDGDEIGAAAQRFAALDPQVRRAWLEEHFAALRKGEVGVEDLPVPAEALREWVRRQTPVSIFPPERTE